MTVAPISPDMVRLSTVVEEIASNLQSCKIHFRCVSAERDEDGPFIRVSL